MATSQSTLKPGDVQGPRGRERRKPPLPGRTTPAKEQREVKLRRACQAAAGPQSPVCAGVQTRAHAPLTPQASCRDA